MAQTPPDIATPEEIALWQLDLPEAKLKVDLPKLQRGFVWTPGKVMDLWDSMLCGYPVGSLLLSEITTAHDTTGDYWLLDGQQRATSIAMGFHNPWRSPVDPDADPSEREGWSLKKIPSLWLDLVPPQKNDRKRFFTYMVNQSHPWGYTAQGATLEWKLRRDALKHFSEDIGNEQYTSFPMKDVFPWAAKCPVPLAFVLETASEGRAMGWSSAEAWATILKHCNSIPEGWHGRHGKHFSDDMPPVWDGIYRAAKRFLDYRIHLNYLREETVSDDAVIHNDPLTNDDNSLLFVRLNSGGTTLGGEEMIFSLFKSAFPKAKDSIEKAGAGFMAPSHLFSLFVRLVLAGKDPLKLPAPLTLAVFKSRLSLNDGFREKLEEFIAEEVGEIMAEVRGFLTGDADFQLPPALATRTLNKSPEAFLALMFWFRQNRGANKPFESHSESHRQILGAFTALAWFGGRDKKSRQRTLTAWMGSVANGNQPPDATGFWQQPIRQLFSLGQNPLPTFPDPEKLLSFALEELAGPAACRWDKFPQNPAHEIFDLCYPHIPEPESEDGPTRANRVSANVRDLVDHLRRLRELLLFAQRHYIKAQFSEFGQWEFVLQDTNCPWDWDHIYPSATNKRRISHSYRDWHHTIGNLRAEALSSNRINQADEPSIKLEKEDIQKESFISPEVWKQIKGTGKNIKDAGETQRMIRIIITRMIEAYKEWYDELRVKELL